ncbi:hypothetical protein BH09BAC1_BH09BAC1_27110 [soil metagenome]
MIELLDAEERIIDERYIEYKGFWPRLGAVIIDVIIMWVVSAAFNVIAINSHEAELTAILSALATIATYLYYPLMEGASGATLGKKALKMVIVDNRFEKINYRHAFMRNIFRLFSGALVTGLILYNAFFPLQTSGDFSFWSNGMIAIVMIILLTGIFDIVVFIGSEKHQALHDIIAGTYVVGSERFGSSSF